MSSFSSIAHSNLEICSPVPWQVYRELLLNGAIPDHPEILDIGCGKGAVLAKAIELLDGQGTGVELENSLANDPTFAAQKLESNGKLKFVFTDASLFLASVGHSFDLIICVGSSHALGGPDQLFSAARKHLSPNGKLLFGELVWKSKPDQEFLNFLECAEEDQMYSSQLLELARKNRLSLQRSISCTPEDFEEYESKLRTNMINWCKNNSNDPRASEFMKRSDIWWDAREKWARQAFGFEIMLVGLE
jgi:cyclopropane fatty-acyl-phospholipid synthase-like methyltransferase